jgi:hypothetical protein
MPLDGVPAPLGIGGGGPGVTVVVLLEVLSFTGRRLPVM